MSDFYSRMKRVGLEHKSELVSVAVHLALAACLVGGIGLTPRLAPLRLPGTTRGVTVLTYYAPGSARAVVSKAPAKKVEKAKVVPVPVPLAKAPEVVPAPAAAAETGVGSSAQSGLGEGDITIALETYFPYPKPDLSGLPHGTKGDVILDAVVDEHGRISQVTLVKGLGSPVDESVIATVQRWTYTPAIRHGVPVASERELHFHYERG